MEEHVPYAGADSSGAGPLPYARRLVEVLAAASGVTALYFAAGNPVVALQAPVSVWLDETVPFVPHAVWLYLPGYFASFFLTAWTLREARPFRAALVAFSMMLALALPFFLLYPVAGPRPPAPGDPTLTAAMVRWLYANDPAVNTFPSLHVANVTVCAVLSWRHHRRVGALVWALAAGVFASVLLLKQHWAVDLVGGWLLAAVGVAIWRAALTAQLPVTRLATWFANGGGAGLVSAPERAGSRSPARGDRSPGGPRSRSRRSSPASPGGAAGRRRSRRRDRTAPPGPSGPPAPA